MTTSHVWRAVDGADLLVNLAGQMVSWVHVDAVTRATVHPHEHSEVSGPVLLDSGFRFAYRTLEGAVAQIAAHTRRGLLPVALG